MLSRLSAADLVNLVEEITRTATLATKLKQAALRVQQDAMLVLETRHEALEAEVFQ